jgi:hypothetical protein
MNRKSQLFSIKMETYTPGKSRISNLMEMELFLKMTGKLLADIFKMAPLSTLKDSKADLCNYERKLQNQ